MTRYLCILAACLMCLPAYADLEGDMRRQFNMTQGRNASGIRVPNFVQGYQINGSNVTATEAALIDGVTAGTVTASKAVVVDANKDIGDFRNLDVVNLDAGASGTAGTVDVFPTTASKGKVSITAAASAGDTTTTIVNASQAGARTYTIPDAGASGQFVMTTSTQTVFGAVGRKVSAATAAGSNYAGIVEAVLNGGTLTFAANTLAVGDVIRFRFVVAIGDIPENADTFQLRVRVGGLAGTIALQTLATDVVDNDVLICDGSLVIRTSTTGHVAIASTGVFGGAALGIGSAAALAGLDLTSPLTIDVTGVWSDATDKICAVQQANAFVN